MSFALYLIGFAVFLGGVAWGLSVAGVPGVYIGIAVVVLLGLGIVSGATKTRGKDPSPRN